MALPVGFSLLDTDTLQGTLNTEIHTYAAILRAAYASTNLAYIHFSPGSEPKTLIVRFSRKNPSVDLAALAGEFLNDLIDHELRLQIARETSDLRTLLVAQAFAEGNLLDPGPADKCAED